MASRKADPSKVGSDSYRMTIMVIISSLTGEQHLKKFEAACTAIDWGNIHSKPLHQMHLNFSQLKHYSRTHLKQIQRSIVIRWWLKCFPSHLWLVLSPTILSDKVEKPTTGKITRGCLYNLRARSIILVEVQKHHATCGRCCSGRHRMFKWPINKAH